MDFVDEKTVQLRDELGARVVALEQKALHGPYRGPWREGDAYKAGDWISHDGALWIVQREAKGERPGKSAANQLAVKRAP